ncbi:hypothetical protein [Brucella sp. NBRC 12950]|uniref:hypothetical protein n=1 Tax=Brucella sp. NBRC 12950 TaxID=2994518 RepID=UPI0024A3E878|nr:hypothetical protein [Brucella sp. NBRC 12950]GLU29867.1 hypothetical protein Brsp01_51000 [Brucella sp. NBRC 12950]
MPSIPLFVVDVSNTNADINLLGSGGRGIKLTFDMQIITSIGSRCLDDNGAARRFVCMPDVT